MVRFEAKVLKLLIFSIAHAMEYYVFDDKIGYVTTALIAEYICRIVSFGLNMFVDLFMAASFMWLMIPLSLRNCFFRCVLRLVE